MEFEKDRPDPSLRVLGEGGVPKTKAGSLGGGNPSSTEATQHKSDVWEAAASQEAQLKNLKFPT